MASYSTVPSSREKLPSRGVELPNGQLTVTRQSSVDGPRRLSKQDTGQLTRTGSKQGSADGTLGDNFLLRESSFGEDDMKLGPKHIASLVACFVLALVLLACRKLDLRDLEESLFPHDVMANVVTVVFAIGMFAVAIEDMVSVNKSAVMLVTAATMWAMHALGYHPKDKELLHNELDRGLEDVGRAVLFLLPAMAVVESIDYFNGFAVVTQALQYSTGGSKDRLIIVMFLMSFGMCSIFDNLTSTIIILKILRNCSEDAEWRRWCAGVIVVASNAGGAWNPAADGTTILEPTAGFIWLEEKITARKTVTWLLLPALLAGLVPLAGLWWQSGEARKRRRARERHTSSSRDPRRSSVLTPRSTGSTNAHEVTRQSVFVFTLGILSILTPPALKMLTGLPPYLGMLLSLSLMWLLTDSIKCPGANSAASPTSEASHGQSGVKQALHQVDLQGLLFFTGVLMAVGVLNASGILPRYTHFLINVCGDSAELLCILLGVSSGVVDNVPMVGEAIKVFQDRSPDDPMWQLMALAASTGLSLTSTGSIAGVVSMSMEGVSFLWYLRHVTPWAALGYCVGIATFQLERVALG